jgi:hypothetical protein
MYCSVCQDWYKTSQTAYYPHNTGSDVKLLVIVKMTFCKMAALDESVAPPVTPILFVNRLLRFKNWSYVEQALVYKKMREMNMYQVIMEYCFIGIGNDDRKIEITPFVIKCFKHFRIAKSKNVPLFLLFRLNIIIKLN